MNNLLSGVPPCPHDPFYPFLVGCSSIPHTRLPRLPLGAHLYGQRENRRRSYRARRGRWPWDHHAAEPDEEPPRVERLLDALDVSSQHLWAGSRSTVRPRRASISSRAGLILVSRGHLACSARRRRGGTRAAGPASSLGRLLACAQAPATCLDELRLVARLGLLDFLP